MPWLGETAMPPAMFGTETLAMVMSSTTMKLPTASRNPASIKAPPFRGAGSAKDGWVWDTGAASAG